ncbi:centrosome-associated protein 350 [Nephila pilipes]|uniref:Centrosome-associated protein 350 n=1 Tax=Nephila pilipes TaxID=299642 RepID=A0A8X6QUW9_NEPPI|nr:centrosome-associated protein 350 [Nephila pilipes]
MATFNINDRVIILGKNTVGTIAFIGTTHFSDGLWFGISLDGPNGRNNGSYEGIRYFKCDKNHGIFVRPCQVKKLQIEGSESECLKRTNRKRYPNYLRNNSTSNPGDKSKNKAVKKSPLKKKREVILNSVTISSEITKDTDKGKQIDERKEDIQDGKLVSKKQLRDVESSSKKKVTRSIKANSQSSDLKSMISKTHKELNEVKLYVLELDKKIKLLKELSLK